MKILNITAQKPDSTGSGIYLTGLVHAFARMGADQAVVAGVYREEQVSLPEGVSLFPVYFKEAGLDFPIPGMSDEMPYESTKYSQMTPVMLDQWKAAFGKVIREAVQTLRPDVILCHHLYLLTAFVRAEYPQYPVYGICHGTGIRQLHKHSLEEAFIKAHIASLDHIFALHEQQRQVIADVYGVDKKKISVAGSGFHDSIFYRCADQKAWSGPKRIVAAGKLSQKKGVKSLIRAMDYLPPSAGDAELILAGSTGDRAEYEEIRALAETCRYEVRFPGRLSQEQLAEVFRSSDVFVLPSFYEGLPLVLIEALACGMQVVSTDLPGIAQWMEQRIPGNGIRYVQPPQIRNADEPEEAELPEFEKRLAVQIEEALEGETCCEKDLSALSWQGIAAQMMERFRIGEN